MRFFLLTVALAPLLAAAWPMSARAQKQPGANAALGAEQRQPRVAVFHERGFPAVDAPDPDIAALTAALSNFDVVVLDAVALAEQLNAGQIDVLVLPFGSAFPDPAWPAVFTFLSKGGRLVNLGGAPFAVPVLPSSAGWRPSNRTVRYFKQLGIVQTFTVDATALGFSAVDSDDVDQRVLAEEARAKRVFEMIFRLTGTKSYPDEDGSDGPREGRVVPLVHAWPARESGRGPAAGRPTDDQPLAAPFVQIDRLEGPFAGGRWLFATGDGGVSPRAAAVLVRRAAAGPSDFRVQPRYAGFHPGEQIGVSLSLARPGSSNDVSLSCDVEVADRKGKVVGRASTTLAVAGGRANAELSLPTDTTRLAPGLYEVRAVVKPGFLPEENKAANGFWIYEGAMLKGGRAISMRRDYFTRGGEPFPVAGTTYMASDVHRRFLLEPNALAWARDFEAMARTGVNIVRTGIWTGWSVHSGSNGTPTEAVLRSIEVFLLTARQHDIPVIFNLFAFVPATWTTASPSDTAGPPAVPANPYFDPKALEAQRRFVGGISARLADADDIVWDLINEPSFSSPASLWFTRPNYDGYERAAWEAWLRQTVESGRQKREGGGRETDIVAALRERWNSAAADMSLPPLDDFSDRNLFGSSSPNKAADYRRFAQDAFIGWVRDVSTAIRANGNRNQLITVGQDEGGAGERPNPLLFGEAVDFTGTHTWWNNDALLWDVLVSKRPDRPSLVGETGLMTYERADQTAWRSEADARNLLERKLVLALAGGGAGFIQWLWNSNVFMPLDNEAGIGLLRADGTAKPELEAFRRVARFVGTHGRHFAGRTLEDVVVVFPQSQAFSVRNHAAAAATRAVRALEYQLHVPVRVIDEMAAGELRKGARLVVVPAPRILTSAAWDALVGAAESGSVVLITGPVDSDEYERPVSRLAGLGIHAATRPVAPSNSLRVGSSEVVVSFRGTLLERAERSWPAGGEGARVEIIARGKGRIVWSPLPVELAEGDAPTLAVYRMALATASISPSFSAAAAADAPPGLLVRPIVFDDSILFAVVNEGDLDATVRLQVPGSTKPVTVSVAAERARLVLVDKRTGRLIGTT